MFKPAGCKDIGICKSKFAENARPFFNFTSILEKLKHYVIIDLYSVLLTLLNAKKLINVLTPRNFILFKHNFCRYLNK